MYWHVQHDDHVFSGNRFVVLANDEEHAKKIVEAHNAEIDRLTAELRTWNGERKCDVAEDGHIMTWIESLEAFIGKRQTCQQDLNTAFDCLTSWLLDNTEKVFEEESEIDEARSAIWDKIEELG